MTTLLSLIAAAARPGVPLDPDTELAEALDEIERVCSLPFWIEETCGRLPTDAELLRCRTLADALSLAGEGAREETETNDD